MQSLPKREKHENTKEKPDQRKPETPKQTKPCSCGQQWDTRSSNRPGWSHRPALMAEASASFSWHSLLPETCPLSWGLHLGFGFTWTLSDVILEVAPCRESDLAALWLAFRLSLKPQDASLALQVLYCAHLQSHHHMDSRIWTLWIKARVARECLNAEEQSSGDNVVLGKQNEKERFGLLYFDAKGVESC